MGWISFLSLKNETTHSFEYHTYIELTAAWNEDELELAAPSTTTTHFGPFFFTELQLSHVLRTPFVNGFPEVIPHTHFHWIELWVLTGPLQKSGSVSLRSFCSRFTRFLGSLSCCVINLLLRFNLQTATLIL